jgi:very-short-patch-repair endonuclease
VNRRAPRTKAERRLPFPGIAFRHCISSWPTRGDSEVAAAHLGVAFKRQVVLGDRYIADFFAPSVGVVVEVDGGVHRGSRAADRRRDAKLQRPGYRVVRVEAALVLRNVEAALKVVREELSS